MDKHHNKETRLDIDGTLPHQASAPSFKGTGIDIEPVFVNEYGVVIGDSDYDSFNSPLEQWSDETDPSIMSGQQWVHPTNDIGWNSTENRQLLEEKKKPNAYPFMHPSIDTSMGED